MSNIEVEILTSEHHKLLVIEGHVDLESAHKAMLKEIDDCPAPNHSFMRYAEPPEDEPEISGWRETCKQNDHGADPVTVSVMEY